MSHGTYLSITLSTPAFDFFNISYLTFILMSWNYIFFLPEWLISQKVLKRIEQNLEYIIINI